MEPERWARVKAIFQAALDRPTAGRAAWLDEACDGDAGLRAEVVSLLDAHGAAGAFIETPAYDGPAFAAGQRVGPYRLELEIGRGGMGTVYLAVRADDAYHKQVAIKVITRGMDTEEVVRRFRHERQTLAHLDHPNIARLLDGGTTDDGRLYLVMEHVVGDPIDAYCARRGLDVEARLRLFMTVAGTVHFAHQNLVVHRDLKPDNILVADNGVPTLVDFGIAKVLASDPEWGTIAETRPADRLMTVDYASPEQLRGEPITTAADVYSLGVLLYELLAGVHPFRRPGRSPKAVEQAVLAEEPPRPSAAAAAAGRRDLARRLAGDLDTIVGKAMQKAVPRRYESAEQFAADLRRHLAGLPVVARPDSLRYRAVKFVGRHRAGVAAAALAVAVLVPGIVAFGWQARVARVERDRARVEAATAERVTAVLQDMLRAPDPGRTGRSVTVAEVLDEAARRLDTELASQPEVRAAARVAIGKTYYGLGLYEDAERQMRAALETRRGLFGETHPLVAESRTGLGLVLSERGEQAAGEAELERALAIYRALGRPDDPGRAEALNAVGSLRNARGDAAGAEAAFRDALDIRRRRLGPDDPAVAETLNNLAVLEQSRARLGEAETLYRESLRIVRAARGDDDPGTAAAMSNLAGVLASKGSVDEADDLYRRTVALRRRLLGDDHPLLAYTLFSYADLQHQRGRYQQAIALTREVLSHRGASLPGNHPVVGAALVVLGRSVMNAGDPAAAEPSLREALALRRDGLPPGHWLTANTESVLGECLTRQGRFAEAGPLVVGSYERLLADRGPAHERTEDARRRVVALYEAWGRPALADPYR